MPTSILYGSWREFDASAIQQHAGQKEVVRHDCSRVGNAAGRVVKYVKKPELERHHRRANLISYRTLRSIDILSYFSLCCYLYSGMSEILYYLTLISGRSFPESLLLRVCR